jgi:OPA family glycerol-3-phosphate transporter-like MFS transporter
MLMVASAATHAINFMYTSISVAKFERFNKTSFVTGAINSSVYIGSAISTYGIAAITTHFGWSGTMTTWLGCAIIGLVVSIFSIKPFKKEL